MKGGGDLQKLLRFCSFFFFVAFSDSFAKETNALTTSHTNLTLDQNCKLRIWHSNVRYNVYENVVLYVLASSTCFVNRKCVLAEEAPKQHICILQEGIEQICYPVVPSKLRLMSDICKNFAASEKYSLHRFMCEQTEKRQTDDYFIPALLASNATQKRGRENSVVVQLVWNNGSEIVRTVGNYSNNKPPSLLQDGTSPLELQLNSPLAATIRGWCGLVLERNTTDCYNAIISHYCWLFADIDWFTTCEDLGNHIEEKNILSHFSDIIEPEFYPLYEQKVMSRGTTFFSVETVYSSQQMCIVTEDYASKYDFGLSIFKQLIFNVHKKFHLGAFVTPGLGRRPSMPHGLGRRPYMPHESPTNFLPTSYTISYLVIDDAIKLMGAEGEDESLKNGWRMNSDIIFVRKQAMFDTLLQFYNETNKKIFRPCLKWLVIVAADTFINTTNLISTLSNRDPRRVLYLGNPIKFSKRSSAMDCKGRCRYPKRLDNVPFDVEFASFSRGAIISRGLLDLLVTKIQVGVPAKYHAFSASGSYCYDSITNDARLGGCIYYELGIPLTHMHELGRQTSSSCASWKHEDTREEITLRYAKNGNYCFSDEEQNNVSKRRRFTLASLAIGVVTFQGRRNAAQSFAQTLRETLANKSDFSPNERLFIYDDSTGVQNMYKEGGKMVPIETKCHYIAPSVQAAQGRFMRAIIDLGSRVESDPAIKFAGLFDDDVAINLLGLADHLGQYIDHYTKPFYLSEHWRIGSETSLMAGGSVFSREAIIRLKNYLVMIWTAQGEIPMDFLSADCDAFNKQQKMGTWGWDSIVPLLARRNGIAMIDVPGIYATTAACTFPSEYLDVPTISMQGFHGSNSRDVNHKDAQQWYVLQNKKYPHMALVDKGHKYKITIEEPRNFSHVSFGKIMKPFFSVHERFQSTDETEYNLCVGIVHNGALLVEYLPLTTSLGYHYPISNSGTKEIKVWIEEKTTGTRISNVDNVVFTIDPKINFVNKNWERIFLNAGDIDFVQIGSNCGTTECAVCGEPIWEDATTNMWKGTVVEPNPVTFDALKANYADYTNVQAIQAAVNTYSGDVTLHIPTKKGDASELSSLKREHVEQHGQKSAGMAVGGFTLNDFWDRFVKKWHKKVDILNTDLEGMDHTILQSAELQSLKPQPACILYEHLHATKEEQAKTENHFKRNGYTHFFYLPGCGNVHYDRLACNNWGFNDHNNYAYQVVIEYPANVLLSPLGKVVKTRFSLVERDGFYLDWSNYRLCLNISNTSPSTKCIPMNRNMLEYSITNINSVGRYKITVWVEHTMTGSAVSNQDTGEVVVLPEAHFLNGSKTQIKYQVNIDGPRNMSQISLGDSIKPEFSLIELLQPIDRSNYQFCVKLSTTDQAECSHLGHQYYLVPNKVGKIEMTVWIEETVISGDGRGGNAIVSNVDKVTLLCNG